ncbi:MAG: LysM peptidoglycan-binding domain-containing protein [Anaerolineae bacterium]|jgi:LysM repeat protein|nr:LysM peptidoglycan-binding domain-containing protein [Anaerolineae bacterium]
MSDRPRFVLVLIFLVLLTLTLSACNRERPVPANATTGTPAARGTVAAPSTGITQVAPPTTTGAQDAAPTPAAPQPQTVVVSPAPASSAGGQSFTYTVVAGDTLLTIATRFGTTPEAIAQLNSLADPNALTLGQKLQIPGAAAAAGAAATSSASATAGGATTGGATSGGGTTSYTVQSGDTLGAIARRFGTTVAELVRINNLANPDALQVGQKLTVPGSGSGAAVSVPTAGQGKTYTVQRGDTLLSIARRFGLTVKQLQAANNITNPDRIFPGQVLTIP